MPVESLQRALKPIDPHFARTRLVCLENTWQGRVLPANYLEQARAFCDQHGLALHLDGARLFNAAVARATDDTDAMSAARAICGHFDSVSVCFSKGLGAPVGSVLLGDAALIERARRWRKVCGGGMRQAGLLAAACLHALDRQVASLRDDHRRAARLAADLTGAANYSSVSQHTNMVFVQLDPRHLLSFRQHCERGGLTVSVGSPLIRLVLHRDIDDAALERATAVLNSFEP